MASANEISGIKKCPFCAEEIKAEAVKCKHCNSMLPSSSQSRPTAPAKKPKAPWYTSTILVISLIIFFFPVGLYGMWQGRKFSPTARKIITGFFLLYTLLMMVMAAVDDKPNSIAQSTGPANDTAQTPPEPTPQEREENCKQDIDCSAKKHQVGAEVYCTEAVEKLAKYDHQWTDGTLDLKFPMHIWYDKDKHSIAYMGDVVKFQNGFGAWQHHKYLCVYDTVAEKVSDASAEPGKW